MIGRRLLFLQVIVLLILLLVVDLSEAQTESGKFAVDKGNFGGADNVMKAETQKTVYEISVEDLQLVVEGSLKTRTNQRCLTAVGNSVGDHIDWFQAIENAISDCIR